MSWFDVDGDGKITTQELDNCKLFARAPHRTQKFLREPENLVVLNSMTQPDFLSLMKMDSDEQMRLLIKLKQRLAPKKGRRVANSTTNKTTNNKTTNKTTNNKTNNKTNRTTQRGNKNSKEAGRKSPCVKPKQKQVPTSPLMSSLFRKSKTKTGTASFNFDLDDDSFDGFRSSGNRTPTSQRVPPRIKVTQDHLNCGVPSAIRHELSQSGVSLSNQTNDEHMFSKLRKTKNVYNKIGEHASTREDSRNCSSFQNLTLPGSDRALRLARLKQKKNGWN